MTQKTGHRLKGDLHYEELDYDVAEGFGSAHFGGSAVCI